MSFPVTIRSDGTIWSRAGRREVPLLLAGEDETLRATLRDIQARAAWSEVPKECWGRLGENAGYRIETERQRQGREQAARAAALFVPSVGNAKNGKLFVLVDERAGTPDVIVLHGVRFAISGFGQGFVSGDWTVKRGYVESYSVETRSPENLQYWRDRANEEHERGARAFTRMMEDEHNDGVRPPAPACRAFEEIAAAMRTDENAAILRVRAQAEESPATQTGFIRAKCAREALAAMDGGASLSEVLRIADSFASDPQYQEAVAGM